MFFNFEQNVQNDIVNHGRDVQNDIVTHGRDVQQEQDVTYCTTVIQFRMNSA